MAEKREAYYTVRLTIEEREQLAKAARDACTSGGTIVRQALKRFLDERDRNAKLVNSLESGTGK